MRARWLIPLILCASAPLHAADGPQVSLNGSLGSSAALLLINGEPHTVRVGDSYGGVKLLSVGEGEAQVEISGKRLALRLGAAQVSVGNVSGTGSGERQIRLSAGPGGHFSAEGSINGRATQFMVDTGATAVSLSAQEADRLGVQYRDGRPIQMSTANGVSVGYLVTLSTVRVGGVEVRNVEAVVTPAPMPIVLLGNSFLRRFQMKREDDLLTLDLRY